MNRRTLRLIVVILLIGGLILLVARFGGLLDGDKCLDAGGRWDAASGRCEGARTSG